MSLLLKNIGQLATCPPELSQADAGLVNQAAVLVESGRLSWCGPENELPALPSGIETVDAQGCLVVPGLIDCHTHLCFGGWRGDEFEMRLQGKTYQEIAAAGGGIRHTVEHTRDASDETLLDRALTALDGMLTLGVTTVECKSGYGLDVANELRQLEIYRAVDAAHPIELAPTFMGAHVVPDEYSNRRDEYIDLICDEMLPAVAAAELARFCDAFVEQGAFSIEEGRRILTKARDLGMGLKIHADQLSDTGAAALAAELGALSAEHLEYASASGMAAMAEAGTVAVSLPLASLYLREAYMPARSFIEAGVRVAVATDFNPGSAPSYHLPLAMTLACLNQQMTPQEVLTGATTIAARAIGDQDRLGSLLPGYQADLALIEAPSLNHWLYQFRANACLGVMKAGEWVAG